MAAVTTAPGLPPSGLHLEASSLSTLPDPRSQDVSPRLSRSASPSPHPDLSSEVATLSNKLISAINYQTNLDDTLTGTRHELAAAKERIRQLEAEGREHARLLDTGLLVKKAELEDESGRLMAKLAEERQRRTVVEKDKKGIEQELMNLSTALFEEANEVPAGFQFLMVELRLREVDGLCCPEGTRSGRTPKRTTTSSTERYGTTLSLASRTTIGAQSGYAANVRP